MGEPVIRFSGVGKSFRAPSSQAGSLKESFFSLLSEPREGPTIEALKDISLEIGAGESVGIVGANRSGKSTLLKLIAGIMQSTVGTIEVCGRVVGMIELGAGFHPDLTGDENVRLQGTINGLTAKEIDERMHRIFEFAELHDFRFIQLKFYSSGMTARLGFAVAIHCEPEIVLVDEVLSVGDQSFQERCLRTITELRKKGTTIIFVTHVLEFAERVCDRLIWLKDGRIHAQGASLEVLQAYQLEAIRQDYSVSEGYLTKERVEIGLPGRFGSGKARFEEIRLVDSEGKIRRHFHPGEPFTIEMDYRCDADLEALDCWIILDYEDGSNVAYWRASNAGAAQRPANGSGTFRLNIPNPPFLPGRYTFTPALSAPGDTSAEYDMHFRLQNFSIACPSDRFPAAPIRLEANAK